MELSELEIKMFVILKNNDNKWKSPTDFFNIFVDKCNNGLSEKYHTQNWICIRLRTLHRFQYLEKNIISNKGQGRISIYRLTQKGKNKLDEVFK